MQSQSIEKLKAYLLSPIFILSLILLLLNDFLLKSYYHNSFTGKLSDFAGISLLTLLFLGLFNKAKLKVVISIIVSFSLWKSAYSQSFIELWNNTINYPINRVVDYADLWALIVVIPLCYYNPKPLLNLKGFKLLWLPMFAITIFAITATSRAVNLSNGTVWINHVIKLKINESQLYHQFVLDEIEYSTLDSSYSYGAYQFIAVELKNIYLESDTIELFNIGLLKEKNKLIVHLSNFMHQQKGESVYLSYSDYNKLSDKYKVEAKTYLKRN